MENSNSTKKIKTKKDGQEIKKNDGTDVKKNDGTGKDLKATVRSCFMRIVNKSGKTLTDVSLTHSSGKTNDVLSVPSLNDKEVSFQKQISYETGWAAYFDYWNISFKIGSATYNTPWNDRCNISYEDAGQVIDCIVTPKSNGDYNLETHMPQSSSCDFEITKK